MVNTQPQIQTNAHRYASQGVLLHRHPHSVLTAPSPTPSGLRHPCQPPPGRASPRHLQSTRFSRRRRKAFQQDCKSVRGRTANHSDGCFRLETAARDGLSVRSAAVHPSPAGSSTSLAPRSAAPSRPIAGCLPSPGGFLHLFRARILGAGSSSYFGDDDIKPGVSSFVVPGRPWGGTRPRAEGRHAESHHFSHAGALGRLSASDQKNPAFEAWLLPSLGWVWDRRDLGCCLAAEAPQGWGKHTIDPVTSQLVSALHYFLT